jgi:hypothetical protein
MLYVEMWKQKQAQMISHSSKILSSEREIGKQLAQKLAKHFVSSGISRDLLIIHSQ